MNAGGGKFASLGVEADVAWAGSGAGEAASAAAGAEASMVIGTGVTEVCDAGDAGADSVNVVKGNAGSGCATAAFGATTAAGLGFTRFGGVTTSGVFCTAGAGGMVSIGVGGSIMRVVKAVVCADFMMLNWPAAEVMIAKCSI